MFVLCCAVLSCPVMSNSVTPWTAAYQAPLPMGILQARILKWVAMPSSRGSSQPRNQTQVSHIAGGLFTVWATGKPTPADLFDIKCLLFSRPWFSKRLHCYGGSVGICPPHLETSPGVCHWLPIGVWIRGWYNQGILMYINKSLWLNETVTWLSKSGRVIWSLSLLC